MEGSNPYFWDGTVSFERASIATGSQSVHNGWSAGPGLCTGGEGSRNSTVREILRYYSGKVQAYGMHAKAMHAKEMIQSRLGQLRCVAKLPIPCRHVELVSPSWQQLVEIDGTMDVESVVWDQVCKSFQVCKI